MKLYPLTAFVLLTLLSSCFQKTKPIYLRVDDVSGLETNTKVQLSGFDIGKIKHMALTNDGKVIVNLEIDRELQLPVDSKFRFKNESWMGARKIVVAKGTSDKFITDKDTLYLPLEATTIEDSASTDFAKSIDNLSGYMQRDSILMELRKINTTLEKLVK